MHSLGRLTRPALMAGLTFALCAALSAFAASGDTVADRVFGQPNFISNSANNGGLSASSLWSPNPGVVDSSSRLWVADSTNNRVLEYDSPLTSAIASRVFGQTNFTTNTANSGGVSASSLFGPGGIAIDGAGRLWVADYANQRVLEYDSPLTSTIASRVFGQPNFTSNTPNNGGVSASSLAWPGGIAVDGGGRLWVAEQAGNRVLEYDSPLTSAIASRVFGQPNFTSTTPNNGGLSASSLSHPNSVTLDSSGRLWVADGENNRVLEYDSPLTSAVANHVFGQPNFTSNTANNGGVSASSLWFPADGAIDGTGRVWVADLNNHRILEYDSPLTSAVASRVFGQPNFTSNTANNGGVSASSLNWPSVMVDGGGRLWVGDQLNNRVLEYDGVASPRPPVGGVSEQPDAAGLPAQTSTSSAGNGAAYALGGAAAAALAIVAAGGWAMRRRRSK